MAPRCQASSFVIAGVRCQPSMHIPTNTPRVHGLTTPTHARRRAGHPLAGARLGKQNAVRAILGIPITMLSDPRGDHAFTRALLLAGLELPCDAGRLQSRSSTKRGERRGGIATGPAVAAGLLLVGGGSAAGLPPALVDACRARHGVMGPFSGAYAAGFVSLAEKSSLLTRKKTLVHFGVLCCHKNTSFCITCF